MELKRQKYYYRRQMAGRGHFGGVEMELIRSEGELGIVDSCRWSEHQTHGDPNDNRYLIGLKNYSLTTAEFILRYCPLPKGHALVLWDIFTFTVDTSPYDVAMATIIGILDLLGKSLDQSQLSQIDEFVKANKGAHFPELNELIFSLIGQDHI